MKTSKELKKSEFLFRLLAENSKDMIFRMSIPEAVFEYVSPASSEIFGYPPEDFYETSLLIKKLIHPDWVEYFKNEWENLLDGYVTPYCEYQIIDNSGKMRWLNQRNTLVRDEKGKSIAIEGVVTDVTERKKSEESLKESEKRFKALYNGSFGGIAIHDMGIIKDCNQGFSDISGYTSEELIGMDGLLCIAEDSRKIVNQNIKISYEQSYEVVGLRKNGEEYPLRLEAKIIPYEGGNMRVVEFRDITEQKKAEEAILEGNQKFELMIQNSPDMLMIQKTNGEVDYVSPQSKDILGFSADEIKHLDVKKQIHPDDLDEVVNAELGALKGDSFINFEYRFIKKNGDIAWLNHTVRPLVINGDITEIQSSVRDITASKLAEQELEEHREHLEELIVGRTKELEEKNKELKRFNKLFVDREFRIKELRDELKKYKK
jgi:PAS domain S-box-containing protein